MNKQFKIFNGSTWTAVKFPAFDSEKLGGKLPSAFSEVGHSHAFSTITGKPTTINGYGITDAYTKGQTDSLLNTKLGATANAASATKLQTARTLTIGSTGKTFDGSSNASWSLAEIGAAAASHTHPWSEVTGKPTFAAVATSGSYADLSNKPTIPTIPSVMTTAEGNTGSAKTQRTIDAANLKAIILNHSPAGARPASSVNLSTISVDTINGATHGNAILRQLSGGQVTIGSDLRQLRLTGNTTRPYYTTSNPTTTQGVELALLSDVPNELAWSTITNTPTTVSGYGITDAYTKTEVNNLLANKENSFTNLTVGKGGTGRSTLTAGSVLVGNGTSSILMLDRSGIDTRTIYPTNAANVATGASAGSILIAASDGTMTHTVGLHADKISTGVLGTARLGTGTASSSTWLRGDGTWQTLPSSNNNFLSSVVNSKNGSQQTLYFSRVGLSDLNTIITGATTSEAGLITTGAQTFAGTKTFNSDLVVEGTIQAATKTIEHTGGSFTLNTATHVNAFIIKNTTFNITVNIPTNAAQAFPVGTEIHFYARNAGQITFSPNSGVTLQSIDNKRVLSKRYGTVTLKKIYTNEWTLFGAID